MPVVDLFYGDGGLDGETLHEHLNGRLKIMYLPGGMASGAPSIALGLQRPDGSWILFETSAKAFLAAAVGINGFAQRHGDVERFDMARINVSLPASEGPDASDCDHIQTCGFCRARSKMHA